MVSVIFVLCLPLRALLYVLLKPPLLLYALIKYCVLTIVSIPAYYLGRLRDRVKLLWSWSHKLSLPWWGRPCTAKATQTLNLQEVVDLSAIPHIPPSLGLKPGHARRDLALSRSSSKRRPPIWKQPTSDQTERLGQSLSHREALASYLVSLLLQPTSPPDSDAEEEERPPPLGEEEAAERALRLILDLVKISKAQSDILSPEPSLGSHQAADIGALCRHAREREKLQSLISELDQLAVEVDPATLLRKRKPRMREEQRRRSRSSSPHQPLSPTAEGEASSGHESEYQEMSTNPDTDTDQFTEASEGSTPDLEEEEEGEHEKPELSAYTESERSGRTYFNPLSPVQESPEYSQRSTSAESISHLESDLNRALSQLDSETSDLRVDEDALALFESQMRRSRAATTHIQGGASGKGEVLRGSLPPPQPPTVSTSTEGEATERLASLSQSEDVFEDCSENFPTIPSTPPSLGLKEGHDRRDLAVSRSSSKRRPPSRKGSKEEEAIDRVADKQQPEQELQEEEEGEVPGDQIGKLKLVGAVPVLPSLVDQIHLLKPGFPIQGDPDSESESILMSTQTESDIKAPMALVTPTPHGQASGRDKAVPVELKRHGSADAGVRVERKSGLSLHIPSTEPPWIEMVERRKSRTTPTPSTPPTLEASLPGNTMLPQLNVTPKPSVPELEGDPEDNIYDTLEHVEPSLHATMYETIPFPKYLHETVAMQQQQQQQQQEVSLLPEHSPQLPPRNPFHKQQNASPVEEREGRSHRSERRSSSSKEKDRHGSESSRRHRSHSAERESRTSSSRHSSSSSRHSSRDKHLRSRSRSQERSSSHSSERHSDKHLNRSSERHSHSSSSSKSKGSESKRRLSSSPSTSRKHSTSNPSKLKESPGKGREKEASSTRKHSSLRESPKSKTESSRPKSETSKSKSESSKSKSETPESKSESSKSSRSKATDKTPEKSSEKSKFSAPASSSPTGKGGFVKALKKTASLTSLRSVKSQGGESTHSLVLESGKETEV